MNITRRIRTTFVVISVAVGLLAVPTMGAEAKPRQITVFDPAGGGTQEWFNLGDSDLGPGADNGDLLLEHQPLVEPGTATPLGAAVTRIQIVDVGDGDPLFIIDCTIRLAGGDLVFYGAANFGDLGAGATFAVTGGTGAYDKAAGTVTVTAAEDGALIAFNLEKR